MQRTTLGKYLQESNVGYGRAAAPGTVRIMYSPESLAAQDPAHIFADHSVAPN